MNNQCLDNNLVTNLVSFIEHKKYLRDTHPLKYLFWESTLRCNLSCLHCGSDCVKDNSTKSKELEVDVIKKELVEIAKYYNPREITFAIIGGEPLVRIDDVVDVGASAAKLGYYWGITTNGMFLNQKNIDKLKKANLKTISVSLDGIEANHNKLRNHKNSYKIVTDGISRLLKEPFYETMDIICCVSKINIDYLEEFVNEMIDLKVPSIRFTPIFAHGRATENIHLMLSDLELLKLIDFIAKHRITNNKINVTLSEEGYYGAEWECRIRDNFHYCGSGTSIGTILYDGKVTGCPSVSRKFIEGNIKKSSFLEIWNKEFAKYRTQKEKMFEEQCKGCEDWILCEGGGFHLLKQENIGDNFCQYKRVKGKEL